MSVNFFISRAGPDAAWAQWIADSLVAADYSVVLQDWDFHPGQDFIAEMDRAMRNAERTIAVLSRSYDRALFTVPEWANAIARDPTGRQALLVPVRVDDIIAEGIFRTRIFIDLVGLDETQARQALLDGVGIAVKRKTGSVSFPGGVTARFPGALTPVWRLPSDRNPVFTGREQELAQIVERFAADDPPPLVAALVGLDGIGKTALAVEYAYRYRQLYKVVWWVRAERQETAIADLALLANQLDVGNDDEPLSARAAAAREWLSSHDQWLLIVDDATDPSVARQVIPQGGAGHVLVTSHVPAWRRHATVFELGSLSEESAAELLARRSGQTRDGASAQLVLALGALPLALELAGAFLEQRGIGADEYLQRLRRAGGLPMDDAAYRPPDAALGFRAVWAESFRVLAKETPVATQLLRLAAFLGSDDIPRPALVRGANRLPATLGPTAVDPDALADLVTQPRAFSLVSTSGDGFSIHRLVQAVIRDGLENNERKSWAGTAVQLLAYVLPRQVSDFRLWDHTGRLIGHALTAADHGVEESVEPEAAMHLLDRGATFLVETGANAEDVAARRDAALRLGEQLSDGPPGPILNNHAVWLRAQGKTREGEAMLEQALDAMRRAEGAGAPDVGVMWTNLGQIALGDGRLDRARTCLERGLAILDRLPGAVESERATAHSLMGQVLFAQGDHNAAAAHFEAAVRGYDADLGPGSLDAIFVRGFLAQALGEDPNMMSITMHHITPASIQAEEGRLLADEPAWADEAERLLRAASEAGEPGAALELADLLRGLPGREADGDAVFNDAVASGDREVLYWHARELAEQIGIAAEPVIRRSIEAGNVFSWYDLGLVLMGERVRCPEAEEAFRTAVAGGFDAARNDLGILLLESGRQAEGENELAEAGRRGQSNGWFNLGQHLWNQPDRREEAVGPLRLAANAGYPKAYGTLAYRLEELGRLDEALAAFVAGVEAGDPNLEPHLIEFLRRHPELSEEGPEEPALQV